MLLSSRWRPYGAIPASVFCQSSSLSSCAFQIVERVDNVHEHITVLLSYRARPWGKRVRHAYDGRADANSDHFPLTRSPLFRGMAHVRLTVLGQLYHRASAICEPYGTPARFFRLSNDGF